MFSDQFRDLCSKKGKSPAQVCEELELSNSVYTYWKKNHSTPKEPIFSKICTYFEVDPSYFDDTTKSEPTPNISKAFIPTNQEIEIIQRYRELPVMDQMELLQLLQKLGSK